MTPASWNKLISHKDFRPGKYGLESTQNIDKQLEMLRSLWTRFKKRVDVYLENGRSKWKFKSLTKHEEAFVQDVVRYYRDHPQCSVPSTISWCDIKEARTEYNVIKKDSTTTNTQRISHMMRNLKWKVDLRWEKNADGRFIMTYNLREGVSREFN